MTCSRIHHVSIVSAAGLVLAAALSGVAGAADLAEVESTKDGDKTVIKVVAVYGEDKFIPKGGEPGEWPEDEEFRPSVGDAVSWTDDVTQGGQSVGSQRGLCTVTDVDENAITNDCASTITFTDGTLKLADELVFDLTEEEGEDSGDTVQIVGGTGAYAGARGSAFIKNLNEESESITATFSTAGAQASQVSQVPAGGAAAGGGQAGGTAADLALIGLGATAALGGAALVARGRRAQPVR